MSKALFKQSQFYKKWVFLFKMKKIFKEPLKLLLTISLHKHVSKGFVHFSSSETITFHFKVINYLSNLVLKYL